MSDARQHIFKYCFLLVNTMNKRSSLMVAVGSAIALSSGFWLAPANAGQLFHTEWQDFDLDDVAAGTALSGNEWADLGLILSADNDRYGNRNTTENDGVLTLYDSSTFGEDNDLMTGQFWYKSSNGRYGEFTDNGTFRFQNYNGGNIGQRNWSQSYVDNEKNYDLVGATRNSEGNLLIIQENLKNNSNVPGSLTPDDEGAGGSITFELSESASGRARTDGSIYRGAELGKIRLIDIDENPDKAHVSFRLFSGDQELFLNRVAETNDNTTVNRFVLSETRNSVATAQDLWNWSNADNGLVTQVFAGVDDEGNNSIYDFNLGAFKLEDGSDAFITKLMVDYEGSGAIADLQWREVREGFNRNPEEIPEPTALAALGMVVLGALKIKRKPVA
ncbi:MAG: hypothetical protein F6K30_08215 [Cyanothece sp. SIO2G6]|nr:hypothetical protein [Cyanothece sp. SIO2G6]